MKHFFTLFFLSTALCQATDTAAQNFRVQIAAYAESMPDAFFREKGVKSVLVSENSFGMYRYFAGSCETLDEAETLRQDLISKGFPFATIIDLEEQRVLSNANCPYTRYGIPKQEPQPGVAEERNIYFDFGSHNLTGEAKTELNEVCAKMKENAMLKLKIFGHTDAVGSSKANVELASDRSRAARNYLIDKGIRADRMFIEVYGESNPLAPNSEEVGEGKTEDLPENRKWNRRVVLKIIDEGGTAKPDSAAGGKK